MVLPKEQIIRVRESSPGEEKDVSHRVNLVLNMRGMGISITS